MNMNKLEKKRTFIFLSILSLSYLVPLNFIWKNYTFL